MAKTSFFGRGTYYLFIDGELVEQKTNKIPKEALIYFLRAGLLGQSQLTNFYLALFSGAVNPQDNWTAANFAANASEIVSTTEGYSGSNRPVWTPNSTSLTEPIVSNTNNLASYSIVASSTLNVSGSALLSTAPRGGTSGTLISATRYKNVHTVNNGSVLQVGYDVELIDVIEADNG